jgi:hypothetical protein
VSRSAPTRYRLASTARSLALPSKVLSLVKNYSMGFRSGKWGDCKMSLATSLGMARRMAWLWWLPRLSMIMMAPRISVGSRTRSTLHLGTQFPLPRSANDKSGVDKTARLHRLSSTHWMYNRTALSWLRALLSVGTVIDPRHSFPVVLMR